MSSESRFGSAPLESAPCPGLYLLPLDDSFYPPKRIPLYVNNSGTGNTGTGTGPRVRIGRQLNQKAAPGEANGVFESRVLSRQHAEVWVEDGRILIRDVKSSNGTFVNGERLSAEGQESEPFELRSDDILVSHSIPFPPPGQYFWKIT
ncbi:SMAD/FHA domain-containing protein [Mycena galericulata]|nr:SMAD/FHA domain-containing protein [Mycena galericulata]